MCLLPRSQLGLHEKLSQFAQRLPNRPGYPNFSLQQDGKKKTVMLRLLDTIFSYVFRLQWPMNTVNCRSLIEHTSSIPNIFSDVVFCNHFKVAIRNQSIFRYHYCFWAFKKSFCKVKLIRFVDRPCRTNT